eukprot:TRINITY_DN5845_c0_g1_i1.p1 TRINITY_DN5845_c0_g1~~TRINITY_DN5845_c0_g1_i1.p1  ORF type:complete len:309 (-),score=38.08 TRINITY_DN5845_c0_g1_i1:202-1128(-)
MTLQLWLWLYIVCAIFSEAAEELLPGWQGEVPKGVLFGEGLPHTWRGEIIQLSWRPRAYLLKNFLSEEECDHIIQKAKPGMQKSSVVDNKTGKSVDSQVRTSTGTFFNKGEDNIISTIEQRVAQVSMLPVEHQEGLQVLHYVDGQKYEPHFDYFHDDWHIRSENGGQRIVTVLMYLTTVEEGGETVFPNAERKVEGSEWSDCARKGLAVKPYRGDALMFFSLFPNGTTDQASMHGSCPTTKGEKWSATKWIHVENFQPGANFQKARWGECVDGHDNCPQWAQSGECEKNPGYMRVYCRKSCKACDKKQ